MRRTHADAAARPTEPGELARRDYELFRALVYARSGINLGDSKQQLVRARLGKRLRAGGFRSFRDYYEFIQRDETGAELGALIDAISTNTTHFFREKQHFAFVVEALRGLLHDAAWRRANPALRLWSAGCSSGEEPYSLAMSLDDALAACPTVQWRILATDISTRVLDRARSGVFERRHLGAVPESFQRRYFVGTRDAALLRIHPDLRRHITFAPFNLMTERFPFRRGFHFIFCRNVMIYFDRPTQQRLIGRFADHLLPGGHLVIGHSESLHAIQHPLEYVRPTIYRSTR